MRVDGVDAFAARMSSRAGKVPGELSATLKRIGFDLQGKSQRRAPIGETGDLRGSAFSRVTPGVNGPTLEVGFEGLPYIIPQHEGGWQNFMGRYGPVRIQNHPHGGESKFLENPWLENKRQYKDALRDAVTRGLRG